MHFISFTVVTNRRRRRHSSRRAHNGMLKLHKQVSFELMGAPINRLPGQRTESLSV